LKKYPTNLSRLIIVLTAGLLPWLLTIILVVTAYNLRHEAQIIRQTICPEAVINHTDCATEVKRNQAKSAQIIVRLFDQQCQLLHAHQLDSRSCKAASR